MCIGESGVLNSPIISVWGLVIISALVVLLLHMSMFLYLEDIELRIETLS